jgi:DUF1365 family protein
VVTTLASALYPGAVMHRRAHPPHRFVYPVCPWLLDVDELVVLDRTIAGFGHNRRRPVVFRDADHFAGTDEPVAAQLRRIVTARGCRWPGGPVRVLTHCRVLGYVFNPISIWYCFDRDGHLDVVAAEVNNTFGDRHCYVAARAGRPDAAAPGGRDWLRWADRKVLHVSPFFSTDGTYAFAIEPPGEHLRVRIDLTVGDEPQLAAAMALRRERLGRWSAAALLVRYPFMTARVTGAIHWEALRLWRRGATFHPRPPHDPTRHRGVA